MVLIEERGDQITVTPNNDSSEKNNFHFVDSFLDVQCPTLENNEVADAMFKYSTKFLEMYLEGLLNDKFSLSLSGIYGFEMNNRRDKINEPRRPPEDDKEELDYLFSRFCQLVKIESQQDRGYGNKFVARFGNYTYTLRAMHLCRKLSNEFSDLLLKAMAKCFYECSEDQSEIELMMPGLSGSKRENMALREILKEALGDPNKFSCENSSLSRESFDNLVKLCLELVV
ncbi:hypothetical protein NBO_2g0042 [Nosema bombycis CQ1]|uniref:Uncharacterized protein n=1 Tax=Nosema bombycis (strain CQ1 / CVCC 102059) TaxID=578461 RepID=R0MMT9_NOSB1|nr:hypothetical protein NBO_2g0042 [Nosema bombycis CQ1]|eukprot:EOB15550.1 hypothetical protein NBO_2g0042 [Nosema bombycis CQ1]